MTGMGAAIAIDHGGRRTGFAVADALRITTAPLGVVELPGDSDALLDHVAGLLAERDVSALVVGLPCHADGSEGGQAAEVRAFVARLRARFPAVGVALQDEHLSSREADAQLVDAGFTGDERKARRDSWAALVILRDWMEAGEPIE